MNRMVRFVEPSGVMLAWLSLQLCVKYATQNMLAPYILIKIEVKQQEIDVKLLTLMNRKDIHRQ